MGRPARDDATVERQRREMLLAAARVFGQRGYRASTMAGIAAEAGCSPPTLYAYFDGKAGILEELVELLLAELDALFRRPWPAGLTLAQELELAVHHQLEWAEDRRGLLVAAMRLPATGAMDALPEELREKDMHEVSIAYFEALAARHIEELGEVSPREAGRHLFGLVNADFLCWIRNEPLGDASTRARRIVRIFLYGAAGPRGDDE